jgi:DNA-binding HxlR family transcriptional regulator
LSRELKQLEASGLIKRKQYPEVPPKVEYSLTPAGEELVPMLDTIYEWGVKKYGVPLWKQ